MKYMKLLYKKKVPIFLALLILLTLLSITPACILADEQKMPPISGSGDLFNHMKTRMTESVNVTIESLENSKENLDNESTLEAVDPNVSGNLLIDFVSTLKSLYVTD
jgi:hypothetical protein